MSNQEFIHLTAKAGSKIRQAREAQNLSQDQLAKVVDASLQQIAEYERGDYDVAVERLFKLAETLQIPVATILAD